MSVKKAVLITSAYDFGSSLQTDARSVSGWPRYLTPDGTVESGEALARFTTLLVPPLGILALGSYLAAHDVPVELIDVQMDFGFGLDSAAERLVCRRVARHLCDQAEAIAWVGISQLSSAGSSIALAGEVRAALPDVPIVFGGYFPSSVYRELLREYPFVTAVVRGDGEEAALEISRSLVQGRSFLSGRTPNLAWLDDGEVRTTDMRAAPVDDLPILDFRLLRNHSCYQLVELMTSRGCPFRCSYCLESGMRSYAEYPVSWVARQLSHIEAELPNERVFFFDPIFGLGRKRTLALCEVMGERCFTYALESRVDVLAPELLPPLRAAGVEQVYVGFESASPSTLLRMNKVRSTAKAEAYVTKALEIARACFENNVTLSIGFMLGFPGDTEDDYRISLQFVRRMRDLHAQVAARTGFEPGFMPLAFNTKVYDGSPLAACVASDYPQAILRSEPFIGKRTVLSPSSGVDLEMTKRYQADIWSSGVYTPAMLERFQRYSGFSMEAFLVAHPELTDSEGVVVLGDSLRRFPQRFRFAPGSRCKGER